MVFACEFVDGNVSPVCVGQSGPVSLGNVQDQAPPGDRFEQVGPFKPPSTIMN